MKYVALILTLAASAVFAQSLSLNPGETKSQILTQTVTATCIACPPSPPPVEVPKVVPMPGNSHAVIHGQNAKLQGYAKCQECHAPNSTEPAKVSSSGVFLCSQFDFCTSGTVGGKTNCASGVTFKHPVTGEVVVDPISKNPIVTGGDIGGYAPGTLTPQCRDCHYPHKSAGWKEPPKSMIHVGCLDCHVGVGKSDVKAGIKK